MTLIHLLICLQSQKFTDQSSDLALIFFLLYITMNLCNQTSLGVGVKQHIWIRSLSQAGSIFIPQCPYPTCNHRKADLAWFFLPARKSRW